MGRKPTIGDDWKSVTFAIPTKNVNKLDAKIGDGLKKGNRVSRADIIRALVQSFIDAKIDISQCKNEADIADLIDVKKAK